MDFVESPDLPHEQYEAAQIPPWGWRGTFKEFRSLNDRDFLQSLLLHLQKRWSDSALSLWQIKSWLREFELFQILLQHLRTRKPAAENAVICFEYEQPLELGERPDVLLYFPNGVTFVFECKNRHGFLAADLEQIRGYKQRLELFHSARKVHAVLLLLKKRIETDTPESSGEVTLADTSDERIERLCAGICDRLADIENSSPPKSLPFESFSPLASVVASVAQTMNRLVPATHETSNLEENVLLCVKKAQECAEHVLLVVSGELHSGKSACALRAVASSAASGISSLFLTGDEPFPKDVRGYLRDVGAVTGKTEVSCLARGMSQFLRFATRRDRQSPFHFIAFDNADNCLFPSTSAFPFYESALIEFADKQDWSVILVFVSFEGEFWCGKFVESIKHWFQRLLIHERKHAWKFACVQPFGVAERDAAAHGISIAYHSRLYLGRRHPPTPEPATGVDVLSEARSYFNCDIRDRKQQRWMAWKQKVWRSFLESEPDAGLPEELVWSRRLLTHKVSRRGVAFIHEIAAQGNLKDIPHSMLTWDVLSVEEDELGRTPIRHAAKYGWIDQIPPAAVADHFKEVSRIAREAVENSRMDGRSERRFATQRWLIKVAIAQVELLGASVDQIAVQLEQLVGEAVASGTFLRAPEGHGDKDGHVSESTEILLQRYLDGREEKYLDAAIYGEYLTRLLAVAPNANEAVSEATPKKRQRRQVSEPNGQKDSQRELF